MQCSERQGVTVYDKPPHDIFVLRLEYTVMGRGEKALRAETKVARSVSSGKRTPFPASHPPDDPAAPLVQPYIYEEMRNN